MVMLLTWPGEPNEAFLLEGLRVQSYIGRVASGVCLCWPDLLIREPVPPAGEPDVCMRNCTL